ncbi:MAG: Glu/Leu/Phe/Val dehydrogenase [Deltaproteobacteria bacterium]|nr:Glu/Leu/Phe/Val dehydrogenase [Deltaproteobacteria bacterium]
MVEIETINRDQFEQIVYCSDPAVGLKSIIAIHDTTLGPATGGCRFFPYPSEEDALKDVLRLAKGMTYKSALSDVAFGGGKAVIIGDPQKIKTKALLQRFAQFVNTLNGHYITAKDVGISGEDLRVMSEVTQHILGIEGKADSSGDPSIATAFGMMRSFDALAKEILGKSSLKSLTFAIQGVGSVGHYLAENLGELGANVIITDIDQNNIRAVQHKISNIQVVNPNDIYGIQCDFFVPCALGGILNQETIPRLKCGIVAGSANNQLATLQDGFRLSERSIFYAPDYVVNAGGIINIAEERLGYDRKRAFEHVGRIYNTVVEIIRRAKNAHKAPFLIADQMAEEILEQAKKKNTKMQPLRNLHKISHQNHLNPL